MLRLCIPLSLVLLSCAKPKPATPAATPVATMDGTIELPAPYATKSVKNYSVVVGWPAGTTPVAAHSPIGSFFVEKFADNLINPRNLYVGPNGDVFVAEANRELEGAKKLGAEISGYAKAQRIVESARRITLLRDADHDGKAEVQTRFLVDQNQPFGMLIKDGSFYVANMDGVSRFPYKVGDTSITAAGQKILDLPVGGYNNHWTRNLVASPSGDKLYVSVGSGSNAYEHGPENEQRRADILEIDPDGTHERVFASGLRNPCGMAWQPGTKTLWTSVNERDELGDDLVPDYLTHVQDGGFYGWPWSYWGAHVDPRVGPARPDMVARAIVPDVSLGAHTASLGLTFYDGTMFPARYRGGAFIGQHGSWNRATLAGYKVVFVPFADGKPSGPPEDFLTGFIADEKSKEVHGRPVNLAVLPDGSLLVADDSGNCIWRVSTG